MQKNDHKKRLSEPALWFKRPPFSEPTVHCDSFYNGHNMCMDVYGIDVRIFEACVCICLFVI